MLFPSSITNVAVTRHDKHHNAKFLFAPFVGFHLSTVFLMLCLCSDVAVGHRELCVERVTRLYYQG